MVQKISIAVIVLGVTGILLACPMCGGNAGQSGVQKSPCAQQASCMVSQGCFQKTIRLVPGLSAKQKDQIFKAWSAHQDKMYALKKQQRTAAWALHKLLKQEKFDKIKIKKSQGQIAKARDGMLRERQAYRLAVGGLLNPDQRKAYFCCGAKGASCKKACPLGKKGK
jgi:hypothetical protein